MQRPAPTVGEELTAAVGAVEDELRFIGDGQRHTETAADTLDDISRFPALPVEHRAASGRDDT